MKQPLTEIEFWGLIVILVFIAFQLMGCATWQDWKDLQPELRSDHSKKI